MCTCNSKGFHLYSTHLQISMEAILLIVLAPHLASLEKRTERGPDGWDISSFYISKVPFVLGHHRLIYGPYKPLRRRQKKTNFVGYHRAWKHGTLSLACIKLLSYGIAPAYLPGTSNGNIPRGCFFQ